MIYKRGRIYWYEFIFDGKRIRRSTEQSDKKEARRIEAAERTRLARVKHGLEPPASSAPEKTAQPPTIPSLKEFAPTFREHIKLRWAEKGETVRFYLSKVDRLLEYAPLASASLDAIDEHLIESYVAYRSGKKLAPATINRELATLRRLLYLAKRWKIIIAVPKVEMLSGERVRDFVLSREDEKTYLEFATGHLRDAAILLLDTGLRVGELVALCWHDVHLEPVGGAKFGYLLVRTGKTKNAKRTVPLTARVSAVLDSKLRVSERAFPIVATTLNHLHAKLRDELGFPSDFVLHSMRHTMLTRLGQSGADSFTIKRIAGHSSITVSERYVHPTPEHVERMFERFESYATPTKVPTVPQEVLAASAASPVS